MRKFIIPPVFLSMSLILIILFHFMLPKYNFIHFPFNCIGSIFILLGFAIIGKTRNLFKKHSTTVKYKKSNYMITDEFFAKTRNPMYIGMFFLIMGIGICFMNIFSILTPFAFILTINFVCLPIEEKMMFDAFGQEYLDYKKTVRRWI